MTFPSPRLFRLLVALAAVTLALGFMASGEAKDKPAPAQQAITSGIGALGRIEPRSRVINLSHDAGPEGVRIEQLNVQEGQLVKKGDVIALFSDHERKQAKLAAAQARIPMLEARIKAEQANLQYYNKEYARAAKLVKTAAISVSRADETLRQQRQSTALIESLQSELTMTIAEVDLAKEEVKQTELKSPIDGTILKIKAWPGERVGDSGVVELADLTQMDVVAEVYERDMARVKVGQKAEIFIPGSNTRLSGVVRERGYLVRKNDLNDTDPLADRDNRVVEVRITLPPENAEILSHLILMQVDVRLL